MADKVVPFESRRFCRATGSKKESCNGTGLVVRFDVVW